MALGPQTTREKLDVKNRFFINSRVPFIEAKQLRSLMKKFFLPMMILILSGFASAKNQLIITVEGLPEGDEGVIHLYLYNNRQVWDADNSIEVGQLDVRDKNQGFYIDGIKSGDYALSAFFDKNSNGILDRNILGIPEELFALSNIEETLWSPPAWDKVKFTIKEDQRMTFRLKFKYQ